MRISDWSSDVCSSDLRFTELVTVGQFGEQRQNPVAGEQDVAYRAVVEIPTGQREALALDLVKWRPGIVERAVQVLDRQTVVEGTSVSVVVDLGCPRIRQTNHITVYTTHPQHSH